jgi:hypothetical protein
MGVQVYESGNHQFAAHVYDPSLRSGSDVGGHLGYRAILNGNIKSPSKILRWVQDFSALE